MVPQTAIPTGPYTPRTPGDAAVDSVPWLVDRFVRQNRAMHYGPEADKFFAAVLGVQVPAGGFVDSDGRNWSGEQNGFGADGRNAQGYDRAGYDREGFNVQGRNAQGQTRAEAVAATVASWSPQYLAAVAAHLALDLDLDA